MKSLNRALVCVPVTALLCCGVAHAAQPTPPALDVYGDLPGIEEVAISPGGARLAIIGRTEGGRHLVVLDGDRKLLSQTSVGDTKIRGIDWIGEDEVMLVDSATESLGPDFVAPQYELYGAITIPLDNSKPWMVFQRSQTIGKTIRGDYGLRQVGGHWLGYFGGIELERSSAGLDFVSGRPSLFAVDMKDQTTHKISRAASDGHYRSWLVDGNGRAAATFDISSATGRWEITNGPGTMIASGTDPTGDVGLVSLGRDGSTVIYSIEDDKEGRTHWYEVPLAGGAATEILADVGVDRVYRDSTNGQLLGYLDNGTPPRPHFFDPARQAVIDKVYRAFPGLHVELKDWTPDFTHVLVHTSGNGDSGTWYLVDLAHRRADPIGNDRPIILPKQVGPVSIISYHASDGTEMDGILTLPPGREAKNLPVVLFPHGGPTAHDEAQFDWWAQAFASRGYAVFQPNFRGSDNRDDEFRRAGYGQWGRKMQTDISDGLTELAKQGIVDPKRACIMGASYGGYAALAGVTLQHGIYRCAVAVAPVSDLHELYQTDNTESGGTKMTWRSLQESLGQPSTFDEVSPRRHAGQADAPIMLIHGKDDTVVPFHQSAAMADALKDAGKPYELVVLREEDHWLSHAATRKQMLEAAIRFVTRYDPAD